MQYYTTLEDKKQFYITGNFAVDKFSNLTEALEKVNKINNKDAIFRGQSEAKYMLYSSLQRLWIDKKLKNHYKSYKELIDSLIHNCKIWNNGLILKYLNYFGSEENEMSILSIMQHYGVPTPMLDFTYDIYKSLFFAIESIDFSPPNSEIDNYFSVYYIFKKNSVLSISELILKSVISYAKTNNIIKSKDLDTTMQFDMTLIDNMDEAYRIQNNLNILNQDGAFIFNSSPSVPLEIHYYNYVQLFNKILEKKGETVKTPREIGGCININKKLANHIKEFLKDKGIDKDSMYPNLNQLRTDCLRVEWGKIRT